MKIPTSLKEVHYKQFLELLEIKELGIGFGSFSGDEVNKVVEKLTRGRVRVLGYYNQYYLEQIKMEEHISRFFQKKNRVFKYLYALPDEDGYHLVATKSLINWPHRRTE